MDEFVPCWWFFKLSKLVKRALKLYFFNLLFQILLLHHFCWILFFASFLKILHLKKFQIPKICLIFHTKLIFSNQLKIKSIWKSFESYFVDHNKERRNKVSWIYKFYLTKFNFIFSSFSRNKSNKKFFV